MFTPCQRLLNNLLSNVHVREAWAGCSQISILLFSVLWHGWLDVRKSIWPIKNWVMKCWRGYLPGHTTTTTVLRPFVRDYSGELVPEETLTHPPSWASPSLYQLLPSTTIHSILRLNCMLGNLFAQRLSTSSWSGALHLIFHTFLHPISVFFSQHMPIPSQPVLL